MNMKTPQEIIDAFDNPVPAEGVGGGQKFMEEFADENSWIEALSKKIDDYWFKYYMLFNDSVPLRCLEILSDDENEDIRCRVADRKDLTHELIVKLSCDNSNRVRCYIASNYKIALPEKIIERFAHDSYPGVRGEIASNNLISMELLLKLAHDDDWKVRAGAIDNDNLPTDILYKLIQDPDEFVRIEAKRKYEKRLNSCVATIRANDTEG